MRKSKTKKNENGASFTEEDDEPLANVATPSEDFEVEKIVDVRQQAGQTEYKVRWKGYASKDDTWERENNLNCQELIDAFLASDKKGKKGKKRVGRPKKTDSAKKSKPEREENSAEEDGDTEYEVEKILEVKNKKNGQRSFLVRWKGYSKKEDTWEPEDHLNCAELIASFLKKVVKCSVKDAKDSTQRETRVSRKPTQHYRVPPPKTGRKHKRRSQGPRRTYNEEAD